MRELAGKTAVIVTSDHGQVRHKPLARSTHAVDLASFELRRWLVLGGVYGDIGGPVSDLPLKEVQVTGLVIRWCSGVGECGGRGEKTAEQGAEQDVIQRTSHD